MDKEHFIPSVIPSPPDERDFTPAMIARVAGRIEKFPKSYSNRYPLPIEDQGNIGACVAYSIAAERCITEKEQTGIIQRFSAGYTYADRFGFYYGEGMIPRDALIALQKYGAVPYKEFPYIDEYPVLRQLLWGEKGENLDRLRQKAKPYRISTYYRIPTDGTVDVEYEIKNALMQGWKVLTVFDVYESFWRIGKDGIVPIPNKAKEKNYGGHMVLTTGWTENNLTDTQNSWGPQWGDKGYCHFPFNYPFNELWVVTDNINRWEVELMDKYVDANVISPWAKEYVAKATELGLMAGDGVRFNPQQSMTREQMAVVVVKLYDKITEELKKG